MNRKEFLKNLGLSSAALMATYCLGGLQGCSSKSNDPAATAATNVDFTLDLTLPANTTLNTNGGFIIKDRVVVARTNTGTYVAVTQVCSHEGNVQVSFNAAQNKFICPVHGATFNTDGTGVAGDSNASRGLKTYTTQLTGTNLRVTG